MSSKQEARQKAAEERAPEVIEIPINDKRRFTPEGDTTPAAAEPEDPPAQAEQDAASQSSLEQLKTQLKEAEAQRGDAERKLSEFADRYRSALACSAPSIRSSKPRGATSSPDCSIRSII
jgi:hypothetical protein